VTAVDQETESSGILGSVAPFLGTFTPRLDEAGRLIVPARIRAAFRRGLVITKGRDRCLFLLPAEEFMAMQRDMSAAPVTDKRARDELRVFMSGAFDQPLDKQNRISIPANLRDYAGLDRDVVVIGAGSRAEVWDHATWDAYLARVEAGYADSEEGRSDQLS